MTPSGIGFYTRPTLPNTLHICKMVVIVLQKCNIHLCIAKHQQTINLRGNCLSNDLKKNIIFCTISSNCRWRFRQMEIPTICCAHLFQQWTLTAINARLQQWQSANESCNSIEKKQLEQSSETRNHIASPDLSLRVFFVLTQNLQLHSFLIILP